MGLVCDNCGSTDHQESWCEVCRSVERSELQQENKRLAAWIDDLQAGAYINCVYCGHRYGPDDEIPSTMAQVLKEHIEVCPEHPMSALKAENKRLQEDVVWEGKAYVDGFGRIRFLPETEGSYYVSDDAAITEEMFYPGLAEGKGSVLNLAGQHVQVTVRKAKRRTRDAGKEDALQEHDG